MSFAFGSCSQSCSARVIACTIERSSAWSAFGRFRRRRPTRPSISEITSEATQRLPGLSAPLRLCANILLGAQRRRDAEKEGFGALARTGKAASLPGQLAADDHAHHLVGAFEDRVDPEVAPEAFDRVILQ